MALPKAALPPHDEKGMHTIARFPCKQVVYTPEMLVGSKFDNPATAPTFQEWLREDVLRPQHENRVGAPPPLADYLANARAKTVCFKIQVDPRDSNASDVKTIGNECVFEIFVPAPARKKVAELLREDHVVHPDHEKKRTLLCVDEITLDSLTQEGLPQRCHASIQLFTRRHHYDRKTASADADDVDVSQLKPWFVDNELIMASSTGCTADGVVVFGTDTFTTRTNGASNMCSVQRPVDTRYCRLANPAQVVYIGPSDTGCTRFDFCALVHDDGLTSHSSGRCLLPFCPTLQWIPNTKQYGFFHANALSQAVYDYFPRLSPQKVQAHPNGPLLETRAHMPIQLTADTALFSYVREPLLEAIRKDLEKDDNIMMAETARFRIRVYGPAAPWRELQSRTQASVEFRLFLTFHYTLLFV